MIPKMSNVKIIVGLCIVASLICTFFFLHEKENIPEPNKLTRNNTFTFLESDKPFVIVYTWVNSSDPAFKPAEGVETSRYRNWNEIVHSIERARIFIDSPLFYIISQEKPNFYDQSDIVWIKQDTLFPKGSPRNSNSNAIEAQLHKLDIKGDFLYLCDDFFIGKELPQDIYHNPTKGIRTLLHYNMVIDTNNKHQRSFKEWQAIHHSDKMLSKVFGEKPRFYPAHSGRPYSMEIMKEIYSQFKDEFTETSLHLQRNSSDIHTAFLYYNYIQDMYRKNQLDFFFKNLEKNKYQLYNSRRKFGWSLDEVMYCFTIKNKSRKYRLTYECEETLLNAMEQTKMIVDSKYKYFNEPLSYDFFQFYGNVCKDAKSLDDFTLNPKHFLVINDDLPEFITDDLLNIYSELYNDFFETREDTLQDKFCEY